MKGYTKLLQLAALHCDDDPNDFLLRSKLPKEEARIVADTIAGRREAATKIPLLAQTPGILYPPHLNRQQCSSQATALFKASLTASGSRLADLTGGMGVDDIFFALQGAHVLHIERDPMLQEIAQWNFEQLSGLPQQSDGQPNNMSLRSICQDSTDWLKHTREHYDYIFADPARRDAAGHRVVSFADCTPNLLPLLHSIFQIADRLLVKASPMTDIRLACKELGDVRQVHVLAVQGECKEALLLSEGERYAGQEPVVHCVNLDNDGEVLSHHQFTRSEEENAEVNYAAHPGAYLYEPNAALMKAGAFRSICAWYKIDKLARNTHLYTSTEPVPRFPGRTFRILNEVRLSPKEMKKLLPEGAAHVISRNYPVKAPLLQQQLKLKEGGDKFIIATTTGTQKTGLLCELIGQH